LADFEIFRSRQNSDHYVAVFADDHGENAAGVRSSHNLSPLTRIADNGVPHLGFDRDAAKRAIADHGFYAFSLRAEERDGHD